MIHWHNTTTIRTSREPACRLLAQLSKQIGAHHQIAFKETRKETILSTAITFTLIIMTNSGKYSDGNLVKAHERWIPQKADRPPNESYRYKGEYYLNKLHIAFDPLTDRWIDSEDQSYVPNEFFTGLRWIQGSFKDAVPDYLQTEKTTT